jgi:hypothetical protein
VIFDPVRAPATAGRVPRPTRKVFAMSTRYTEAGPVARLGVAAALAVAALAVAPAAYAQQSGLRAFKDPVTGQLRAPTAAELKAAAAAKTPAEPRGLVTGKLNPQAVRHANGAISQELTQADLMYSVATRKADGSVDLYCVPGADAAAKVMKGEKTTAKVEQIGKEHNHDEK